MITTLNLTPQLQFRTLLFSFSFTLDMIRLPLSILPSRVGVTTQESLANFVAISLQHSLSQLGLDPTLLFQSTLEKNSQDIKIGAKEVLEHRCIAS